ncbi:uncharacterized protein C8Q71DRAFT_801794 [Rhodofomes roseus]|uniref:Protein kinase domain-containing protein n=1 Tax=Rhodofomes roseus TaxID=34475 RepID=A0ABQ8KU78_9APHY|nr:uncharacterized protein C8Q71DRAFT_801794 [Rhodofomes roseus]KAH9842371.1 hypothetical protein C8Q71DRAFT_801794 [Rhodofomes roseus]
MFSTLTLRGTNLPGPITLSRRESFPARQYDFKRSKYANRPDWLAVRPPRNSGHLSLELGERIGGGRSAVVYSVKVVPDASRIDESCDLDLCIKVARPNRCRSLAREAWILEQLPEDMIQGMSTPRCYGIFAVDLSSGQLPFPLWSGDDYFMDASPGHWEKDDPTQDDPLYDDDRPDEARCPGSPPGARELSPWVNWRPDPDAPLLSVLLMARGGRTFSMAEDDWDRSNHKDIEDILDDLSTMYMLHVDLRPSNVIRAPSDTQECSMHKYVHKWNVIDLASSTVDGPNDNDDAKLALICKLQQSKWRNRYWYAMGRRA